MRAPSIISVLVALQEEGGGGGKGVKHTHTHKKNKNKLKSVGGIFLVS